MPHPTPSTTPKEDISHVSGNASDDIKHILGIPSRFFQHFQAENAPPMFGDSIQTRMVVTEISINNKAEEPKKVEGRVVLELDVAEDMLNGGGNIHGGCSAFLIDVCSTLALTALNLATTGELSPSVSQSLNIVYHSPASLGDRIKIVNTTLTLGARAHSVRTEIWNLTHHRLVASGTHIKMAPSKPKSSL
ncbi:uncharacterized protein LACBIDRAFT_292681 [Laccaria bicolor S238N-H82]|uniref:Predicted protein n=1 Tax=Laccaria bicolor (strain S238N-H82 / ATCC MYA-4686) TaxID=486041 RepID=B0CZJ6_LACBS|nr:uncharacterized protein LACBIDRAFT_292681 [Laccaria bicolor S238N-H82]EDR12638.1 predicted protein [Laccaria bicolor S238N-H82]|eukprot:XP_001876902.1 predicted protein [Laccaria bicolor S238N-H82]